MSEEDTQAAETTEEEASSVSLDGINQNVVKSIPITLNVEVGKTKLKLKDLMAVAQGTVLELDRSVGELMDIKVRWQDMESYKTGFRNWNIYEQKGSRDS